MREALKNVGSKAADEKRWQEATEFLAQAGEFEQNLRANFMAGNWTGLQAQAYLYLIRSLDSILKKHYYYKYIKSSLKKHIAEALLDGSPQLLECGSLYRSLGQSSMAVDCYLRGGSPEKALECAIELNDWQTAVNLAEKYKIRDVSQTLEQKAAKLLQGNMDLQACQLYRKAGNFLKAAHLLFRCV